MNVVVEQLFVVISDHACHRARQRVAGFERLSLRAARQRIRHDVLRALADRRVSCGPRNGPDHQGTPWRFAHAPGAVYVVRRRKNPDGGKQLIVLTALGVEQRRYRYALDSKEDTYSKTEAPAPHPNLPKGDRANDPDGPPPLSANVSPTALRARAGAPQ